MPPQAAGRLSWFAEFVGVDFVEVLGVDYYRFRVLLTAAFGKDFRRPLQSFYILVIAIGTLLDYFLASLIEDRADDFDHEIGLFVEVQVNVLLAAARHFDANRRLVFDLRFAQERKLEFLVFEQRR